ncbi:MAG: ice-binding family protein [Pseudomonadota bacterium]
MRNISKEMGQIMDKRIVSKMKHKFLILFVVAALTALLYPPLVSATPYLGSAQSFAVLGHETVTNGHSDPNLPTQIYGNLGVTPNTSITGFYPDGSVSGGTIHINDGVAQLAMVDATTAYNTLSGLPFVYNYTGFVLGSAGYATLTPGVYHFETSVQLTGALTLDFQGNPDADFIFQIGSTLTTASSSSVNVINGNSLGGVYWQVGSSATLGTDTTFAGNILALASVSLDPRAEILCGRAIALTGSVTLIDNLISNNNTAEDYDSDRSDFGSYGFSGGSEGSAASVPEPSTMLLLSTGLTGLVAFRKKLRKE